MMQSESAGTLGLVTIWRKSAKVQLRYCDVKQRGILIETCIELPHFNFHKTSFVNPPYFRAEAYPDEFTQALPSAVFHIQPKLGEFAIVIHRHSFIC